MIIATVSRNCTICNIIFFETFQGSIDQIMYSAITDVITASVFVWEQENFFVKSESGNVFFSREDVQPIDKKLL